MVPKLVESVFNPKFEVYELLRAQQASANQALQNLQDPMVKVDEKLNELAFHKGLGLPLFKQSEEYSNLDRKTVLNVRNIDPSRIAVVATGVNHSDLEPLVQQAFENIKLETKESKEEKSDYYGGEARISSSGPSIFAVGFPGSSFANKGYYAALILEQLLNGNSLSKWGSKRIGTLDTECIGFHESFSDAGLVGFKVVGKATEIEKVAKDALKALKSATSITAEKFQALKNLAIIQHEDTIRSQTLENLGKEATTHTDFLTTNAINEVSLEEFKKVYVVN